VTFPYFLYNLTTLFFFEIGFTISIEHTDFSIWNGAIGIGNSSLTIGNSTLSKVNAAMEKVNST